jgi:hypothetical protein
MIWFIAVFTWTGCRGGSTSDLAFDSAVLVDDFRPRSEDGGDYGFSRMDSFRAVFGNVQFIGDAPIVDDAFGEGGINTTLGRPGVGLTSLTMLGPYVTERWQASLLGVEMSLLNGQGTLTVELTDNEGDVSWSASQRIDGTTSQVTFPFDDLVEREIGGLTWKIDGFVIPWRVRLLLDTPDFGSPEQEAFLYSYAALARCWNPDVGLVADRCTGGEDEIFRVDTTGLFALASLVANDLGYIDGSFSRDIVVRAVDAVVGEVPVHEGSVGRGLLPERMFRGNVAPDSYWSTLHTAIALESLLLAATSLQLDTAGLETMLEDIDWGDLTTNLAEPIAAGVDTDGVLLDWRIDTFGAKALVVQLAHAGVEGVVAPMNNDGFAPTWDGSGYDNELAALIFPVSGLDPYGNDWTAWRDGAFWQHQTWTRDTDAGDLGLFGLSASEVPEPWTLPVDLAYGDWGVGGQNQVARDGSETIGYSVLAPHYAAMTAAEHPLETEPLWWTLMGSDLLTPLNAVESAGIDWEGALRFNHHHRSWSLALQTLGLGRALSGSEYYPYRFLNQSAWLADAHDVILPNEGR